jgi:hypothetical protein
MSQQQREHMRQVVEGWINENQAETLKQGQKAENWLDAAEQMTRQLEELTTAVWVAQQHAQQLTGDAAENQWARLRELNANLTQRAANLEAQLRTRLPIQPPGAQAERCQGLIDRLGTLQTRLQR